MTSCVQLLESNTALHNMWGDIQKFYESHGFTIPRAKFEELINRTRGDLRVAVECGASQSPGMCKKMFKMTNKQCYEQAEDYFKGAESLLRHSQRAFIDGEEVLIPPGIDTANVIIGQDSEQDKTEVIEGIGKMTAFNVILNNLHFMGKGAVVGSIHGGCKIGDGTADDWAYAYCLGATGSAVLKDQEIHDHLGMHSVKVRFNEWDEDTCMEVLGVPTCDSVEIEYHESSGYKCSKHRTKAVKGVLQKNKLFSFMDEETGE